MGWKIMLVTNIKFHYAHYPTILNIFDNRSTNASVKSFNAKIKEFRATQGGVEDTSFLLFRLAKIYA